MIEVKVSATYKIKYAEVKVSLWKTQKVADRLIRKIQYIVDGRKYQYEECVRSRRFNNTDNLDVVFYNQCIELLKDENMVKKDIEKSVRGHMYKMAQEQFSDLELKQTQADLKSLLAQNRQIKFTTNIGELPTKLKT